MAAEEQTMQDVSTIEIPQSPAELAEVAAAAAPRTEGMPIIHVEGLKRNYGKVEAVKGISFDVYPGEIFGFLGLNGAGKTPRSVCSVLY